MYSVAGKVGEGLRLGITVGLGIGVADGCGVGDWSGAGVGLAAGWSVGVADGTAQAAIRRLKPISKNSGKCFTGAKYTPIMMRRNKCHQKPC